MVIVDNLLRLGNMFTSRELLLNSDIKSWVDGEGISGVVWTKQILRNIYIHKLLRSHLLHGEVHSDQ